MPPQSCVGVLGLASRDWRHFDYMRSTLFRQFDLRRLLHFLLRSEGPVARFPASSWCRFLVFLFHSFCTVFVARFFLRGRRGFASPSFLRSLCFSFLLCAHYLFSLPPARRGASGCTLTVGLRARCHRALDSPAPPAILLALCSARAAALLIVCSRGLFCRVRGIGDLPGRVSLPRPPMPLF